MPRASMLCSAAAVVALAAVAGCDRPVVDLAGPRVEVVRPADLGVVVSTSTLDLALRADVFGAIDSLTVAGRTATFNAGRSVYEAEIPLARGINVLPVDVYDAAGLRGSDTLYAFRGELEPTTIPVSGTVARVRDAQATALRSGDVLFSGGATTSGEAQPAASRLSTTGGVLTVDAVPLLDARAGHSASVLGDDRVLLIGGARRLAPLALAGTAEVVDLETGTSERVAIVDAQSRPASIDRTGHVAHLFGIDGVSVVTLYGGVNAQDVPLGTVDVFRFDGDVLTRLTPAGGASGALPAYAAPALAPIGDRGASEASAVVFGLDPDAPTGIGLDWLPASAQSSLPFDLRDRSLRPLSTPRTDAAVLFLGGFVLVSGGRAADGTTLDTFEAYVPSVDRSFRFPETLRLRAPRSGHGATLFPGGRILILGGRDASGAALSTLEAFQL